MVPSRLSSLRFGRSQIALVTILAVAALGGCSGSGQPSAQTVLTHYLAAWSSGDWATMRSDVTAAPADFTSVNAQVFEALGISRASFRLIGMSSSGDTATGHVAERFTLPRVGVWSTSTTVRLVKSNAGWRVDWSPATITPALKTGDKILVRTVWPSRAQVFGTNGQPLTTRAQRVVIGVEGARIKSRSAVRADLVAAGADPTAVKTALSAAVAHPTYFEPVLTVSAARFDHLKAEAGPTNVYQVPGTSFQQTTSRVAITKQLAAHLVGSVGPITAEELGKLGAPYAAADAVGQQGIEAAYERTLAGTPSTHIDIEDATGTPVKLLASLGGHPGRPVHTSLDPRIQRAAESALAHSTRPNVAMVAIRASTGQVVAVVSDPATTYDTALQGAYPPGSTFKVLTFTALHSHGLSPSSPTSCPATVTVDGEQFHNAAGEGAAATIDAAFTESCNTAFIKLATSVLSPSDITAAAHTYGLDRTPQLGVPAFSANVPEPRGTTELAADAIGQGRLTFSPLGMAEVAAAIDSGTVRAPRLVVGAPDDSVAPTRLPTGLVGDLRTMMAHVAASGTAAGTGLPAGTHVKTGTAEYGTGAESKLKIDGWLMGYDGDIAFGIVTQNTGGPDGGPVDGPLIARFLDAIH